MISRISRGSLRSMADDKGVQGGEGQPGTMIRMNAEGQKKRISGLAEGEIMAPSEPRGSCVDDGVVSARSHRVCFPIDDRRTGMAEGGRMHEAAAVSGAGEKDNKGPGQA